MSDNPIEQTLNLSRADADVGNPVLQVHSQDIELETRAAQYLGNFIVQHPGELSALRLLVLQSRQGQASEAPLGIGVRLWSKLGSLRAALEIRDNTRKFQRLFS